MLRATLTNKFLLSQFPWSNLNRRLVDRKWRCPPGVPRSTTLDSAFVPQGDVRSIFEGVGVLSCRGCWGRGAPYQLGHFGRGSRYPFFLLCVRLTARSPHLAPLRTSEACHPPLAPRLRTPPSFQGDRPHNPLKTNSPCRRMSSSFRAGNRPQPPPCRRRNLPRRPNQRRSSQSNNSLQNRRLKRPRRPL